MKENGDEDPAAAACGAAGLLALNENNIRRDECSRLEKSGRDVVCLRSTVGSGMTDICTKN